MDQDLISEQIHGAIEEALRLRHEQNMHSLLVALADRFPQETRDYDLLRQRLEELEPKHPGITDLVWDQLEEYEAQLVHAWSHPSPVASLEGPVKIWHTALVAVLGELDHLFGKKDSA